MKTRQILYAEDGMVLTNGETYGTVIYLADDVDVSSFHEITKEEYEQIMHSQESETL